VIFAVHALLRTAMCETNFHLLLSPASFYCMHACVIWEVGGKNYLYMLALAQVLHFISKETALFILRKPCFSWQIYFNRAHQRAKPWDGKENYYRAFIITLSSQSSWLDSPPAMEFTHRRCHNQRTETVAAIKFQTRPLRLLPAETAPISLTSILGLGAFAHARGGRLYLDRGYTWEGIRPKDV